NRRIFMRVSLEDAAAHMQKIDYSTRIASNVILVREALERSISVSKSERFNFLLLKFGGKTHRWRAGRNSFHRPLATRRGKYNDACNALLRSQGVNATENIAAEPKDVDRAWAWARHLDAVTIKPNDGKQGADVHVGITGEENFRKVFTQVGEAR